MTGISCHVAAWERDVPDCRLACTGIVPACVKSTSMRREALRRTGVQSVREALISVHGFQASFVGFDSLFCQWKSSLAYNQIILQQYIISAELEQPRSQWRYLYQY